MGSFIVLCQSVDPKKEKPILNFNSIFQNQNVISKREQVLDEVL